MVHAKQHMFPVVQQLTAQFAKEYEEKTGQAVKFRLSFGGSGTQARAVIDGLPGDIGQPHKSCLVHTVHRCLCQAKFIHSIVCNSSRDRL